ncbi:RND family efflux transporter MFP subunit [Neorhizobium sp. 2083]|uniref:efflux RND transporter periplasmic adaptor subunit n=1 Tax=Neorhizobium sp. 2083 TaxID=2817762 RepID=UPI00285D77F2|nr:efflux RND transporter periplasmic adaptor subunit [Neorhizobium sp. 2083]MDR6820328.1 RND family efflux transporter MFP subunit [Neorhizobium sp. 2083]
MRLTQAGLLLGGVYVAVVFIDPARGTIDANERVKEVVQAVTAGQIDKPLELAPSEIADIRPTSMAERLRVSGDLEPINRAVLHAKDGGRIVEVHAVAGQAVKAGDVLVRFETDDLRSILRQREGDRDVAMAEMLLAMQSLNRIEQLAVKNIASQEQLDKARSEVAATTARLKSLSAQADIARTGLRDAEILAPFDGVISKRAIDPGSRVAAGAELFTIVDTSVLEAEVLVSTRDVPRIAIGQRAELRIDGLNGQTAIGRVDRIGPVADHGTRFIPVYIRLSDNDARLRGGMFATGSILIRQNEDAIVIPAISLRRDETGDYVLKLKRGRLVRQPVTVGSGWGGKDGVEISRGLVYGDTIVTVPLPRLKPDVAVTIPKAG